MSEETDSNNLRVLFLTVVAEVISFGVLIPIVPLLFAEPGSSYYILPSSWSVEVGYVLLGLLVGLYPLAQFVSTPILGELSDVYGRKTVIEISILGTIVSSLIFAYGLYVSSILILFISRAVNGFTGGLVSVAQASIADISDKSHKSKNFGIIGMAFGTGFLFGPFLGGVLSSDLSSYFTSITPFLFAALISALSLIYSKHRLVETSPMKAKKIKWSKPFRQVWKGVSLPGLKKIYTVNFFYFSGFAFFTTFIPVYLVRNFSLSQLDIGGFFFYVGLLVIVSQGYLVPKLFSKISEERAMPYTLFLTGLFIFLQPIPATLLLFMVAVTLFSFNNSFTQIAISTIISNRASSDNQGLALGTNQSVRSLANAIPSMLSGVAAAAFDPSAPLTIAGLLIMATSITYILSK